MIIVSKLATGAGIGSARVLVGLVAGLQLVPAGVFDRGADAGRPASEKTTTSGALGVVEASSYSTRDSLVRQRLRKAVVDTTRYVDADGGVVTSAQLERFLVGRRSPLAGFAGQIIESSNRHQVDPRLIVAIAGVESDFGRVCKGYNAWGWANGRKRWRSWHESINDFTQLISQRYPNWRNVRRMASVYNPVTPESWGKKVTLLMASLDQAPA